MESRRVLVVGAGEAGTLIVREMLRHPGAGMAPVAFLDDDPRLQGKTQLDIPVAGRLDQLAEVVGELDVDEVLIAIPSATGAVIRRVVESARDCGIACRTMPGLYDIIAGNVTMSLIREVRVEDLLRREAVRLDTESIAGYLGGRTVMVTGAGGSIGSEIVNQIARFGVSRVILVGRGENSLFQLERDLDVRHPGLAYTTVVADVRRRAAMRHTIETHKPSVIFHAAAHKHVPLMEPQPDEAVLNNVGGTMNLVDLALEFGVAHFVNVSTDKAVNPTSVMGASKRVAEYVVAAGAERAAPGQSFVSVRFGNVLGSRGSVIPLFMEQIRAGGPVTVTDQEMTRYFMTIPEAAQLVIQAGGLGGNGTVYLLDMGDPVRIVDLAEDLIRLCGFEPGEDIRIQFRGTRPGEKLYEELLTAEEGAKASQHEKIFVATKDLVPHSELQARVEALLAAAEAIDQGTVLAMLRELVSGFSGSGRM